MSDIERAEDPSETSAPASPAEALPNGAPAASPQSRLGLGVAIGIAVAALILGALALAGLVALVVSPTSVLQRTLGDRVLPNVVPTSSDVVATAPTNTPWIHLDGGGHGTLKGWSDGSGSSGGGPLDAPGSIGSIGLMMPTEEDGVLASIRAQVLVTGGTKLTMDGKAYEPPGDKRRAPIDRYMSDAFGVDGGSSPGENQMVVLVHRSGQSLVADSIDIDTKGPQAPDWLF